MNLRTIVIVGAGLTGSSAAASLRKRGFDGEVALVGSEPHLPYELPKLSKEFLRGETDGPGHVDRPQSFYVDNKIDLRTGTTATLLRPGERTVVLSDGSTLRFDRLLLATGSAPRPLGVPGEHLSGVHLLRTLDDAAAIRSAAASAEHVVVIGASWTGAEVAASLRQLGRNVVLVGSAATLLERVLGPEVGAVYDDLHVRHGVQLLMNTHVSGLRGRAHVEAVDMADGSSVPADLVVVGVGALPRTEIAAGTGINIGDGIEVDETLETNVPGIFAAGDVASAWHPLFGQRIRVEHWDNAKRQGAAVAAGIMGVREPYIRVPYFYSDQFDLSMEHTGFAPEWDRVVFRGDPGSGSFSAFWLTGGRLVAGLKANVESSIKEMAALVAQRPLINVHRLADATIPLEVVNEA